MFSDVKLVTKSLELMFAAWKHKKQRCVNTFYMIGLGA